ncbi:GntR family transcriptional regulator [Roseibium sp.]|uniref:GntR family transcriptional regulator n=1 Tax=Roseibium sp. TaxID=1936156 RepID=UPI003D13397C
MNERRAATRTSRVTRVKGSKQARKSDAVYEDLRRMILTGRLTSDSPITEQALAQDYGCSQGTVREALMLLNEFGLVVRRGYQGTFVTDPTLLEAQLMLKLRVEIETTGIVEAVRHITPDDLAELRELDRQFLDFRMKRDVFGCAETDRALHLKLFQAARMPVLEPMLVRTIMLLQRVMLPGPRSEAAWTRPNVTHHCTVFEALEDRDEMRAVTALKRHILSSAVLLAPQFYGTDLDRLQADFDLVPLLAAGAAGR